MADTAQDRTEPATPRRREEARSRGQVAKSTDLTAAVTLLGGLVLLYLYRESMVEKLVALIRLCLGSAEDAVDPRSVTVTLLTALRMAAELVLPLMLVVLVLALITGFGQVGWLFTLKPLRPSLDKLNPINGMKRMFSARTLVQLAMGLAKTAVLGMVAYFTMKGRLAALAIASTLGHVALAEVTADFLFTLGLRMALALLILAIIDLIYQRWKMERDLRMTRQEVREELKRMEGDPHIKRRRREMQMQLALRRIRAAVPKADVVITNPTHFAVALQYDSATMSAPQVVAKGADILAQRIRELAIEHRVPIVERPPLARALYRECEVGQQIPAHFFRAVAEILAYVYELAGRGYARRPVPAGAWN